MSARAIPAELENEVIEKSLSGWSLRRIAEWLSSEKRITASHTAVAGVLQRQVSSIAALIDQEPMRQFKESLPTLLESLDKVEEFLKEIIEDTQMLPALRRITTRLSAVRSWQRIVMFKFRVCGYGAPPRRPAGQPAAETAPKTAAPAAPPKPAPAPAAPAQPAPATSNIAATIAAAIAPPVVPTPSRNGRCPCGSTKKYKACHGKPGAPPLNAA